MPTPKPEPPRNWHRLFGLLLAEHLAGSPFVVELENDPIARAERGAAADQLQ